MNNPNEKLLNALKKFYEYKSKELRDKYPLNQTVSFYLGDVTRGVNGSAYFILHADGRYGVSYTRDKLYITTELKDNFDKVHQFFFEKYANMVKELEELKKEEDALFRAVERMEARDVTQEEFSL